MHLIKYLLVIIINGYNVSFMKLFKCKKSLKPSIQIGSSLVRSLKEQFLFLGYVAEKNHEKHMPS